ncbi:MAG: VOC family protein [Planctomyces sp.]|nr:VOC family protein [Planctomyces sp.]
MEPRISLITLGVSDLDRSLRFYRDGLGLPTTWTGDKGVVFFRTGGTRLALYPQADLLRDVGRTDAPRSGDAAPSITLAHNVRDRGDVERVLAQAVEAGATLLKPAHDTFWGGCAGYFADPDGHVWEVAWGAFEFAADGSLEVP